MELAIDTSTNYNGIALSNKGKAVAEFTWYSWQNHTTELLPNIHILLSRKTITINAIKAIFVAIGPGSFNGLRVGVSTAKGLAAGLNAALVAISTLEIEAYQFADTYLPIIPIQSAGKGEIAIATYQKVQEWHCLKQARITTVDELLRQVKLKTLFCGEIPEVLVGQLQQELQELAIIPDNALRLRKPGCLAQLGWQRLINHQSDNPATLQPIYLREPPITISKQKTIKK